ncbi:hybrid sensor histidine kinase/response regulator [Candidatus Laterigemmans baculatus]|uniref:hybrid sensor histidine kinase/response regulator n=1 Tax=Candidatus Laterigemmans baculatus TaxID=2770505 RepID=UPI0013DC9B03|nr:ATP-binding protein [Candidatus Laterigemmans baculatus]
MDAILNAVPCGFLSFAADGTIVRANARLAAMVEREQDSLVGLSIEKLLTTGARVFYQTHFFPLLRIAGAVEEIYLTLQTAGGREVPVLVNAERRERDGADVYDCVVFSVRQRGEFEDQLLKAKRAAEDAARTRDDFLAVVSHELRTPLNAILGWAQILRLDADPDTIEQGIDVIERNAKAQARLIEDLIDVSRIVSGKLRLEVQTVDPRTVIKETLDVIRFAAEAKSICIQTVLDPDAGPVSGDPNRLQQVLWNLLSNAVKFTPKGGFVRLRLQRVNSQIEILVTDSGQGIDPQLLPYVFERFRQGTDSHRHGGLGLGMAITKEIVQLHGGSIRAHSDGQGKGATFIVTLPVLPVHASGGSDASSDVHVEWDTPRDRLPRLEGIHVLLVDDAPDVRDVLNATFLRSGARVTTAASAAEAFDRLQELRPTVLVSDIEMPDEDGLSLMRRIRTLSAESGRATPAVALTANGRAMDRKRALSAGFQVHLTKPIDPDELVMVVANLCEQVAG